MLLRINFNGFLSLTQSNSFPSNHFSPFAVLNIKLMKRIHIAEGRMRNGKRIQFLFYTHCEYTYHFDSRAYYYNKLMLLSSWLVYRIVSRQHLIWKFLVANVHHFYYKHYPSLSISSNDWHVFSIYSNAA